MYWLVPLVATLSGLLFFLLGQASNRALDSPNSDEGNTQNPLLKRIFASDVPVSIVVADTNLVVLQNVLHTDISIDEYISKDYPQNILNKASSTGVREVLTGLALRKFPLHSVNNFADQEGRKLRFRGLPG